MWIFHVGVRRNSRSYFPQNNAIRIDVCLEGVLLVAENFRSHPVLSDKIGT